jgi:hypothetical protein
MITRISLTDGVFQVYLEKISLKATKSFTHGTLLFTQREVSFAELPAVPLPAGFIPVVGLTIRMQLVGPDGKPRKQTRTATLAENPKQPGQFRAAGQSKTDRRFAAGDGWTLSTFKFRAYFNHPGIQTDAKLPEWLRASIDRQHSFWNRLAYLCFEARRMCSVESARDFKDMVDQTILPAIDGLNRVLERRNQRMKFPDKLRVEAPTYDDLWRFIDELRRRIKLQRPTPDGLLPQLMAFAEKNRPNYAPLYEFLRNFGDIAEREAAQLGLRHWEFRPVMRAFETVLSRRKAMKLGFSEGWPLIKHAESTHANDWGIHYNLRKAGILASNLETEHGIPGLTFGPPANPEETGHPQIVGTRKLRKLRQVHISIPDGRRNRWDFTFAVLQHRELPAGSHVKEWKLLYKGDALWLSLVVEHQGPVTDPGELAAGLDMGWRKLDDGIRFGMLYEPAEKTFRELRMNLLKSPANHSERTPFQLDLGATRWEKRNVKLLQPDWAITDPLPTAFHTRMLLQARRDHLKDLTKVRLKEHLRDNAPAWLDRAGRRGLARLMSEQKGDPILVEILAAWKSEDDKLGDLVSSYLAAITKRIEYGHLQIAHDICRHLAKAGIHRLNIKAAFLAKMAQGVDIESLQRLGNSRKYRQFVNLSAFVERLHNIAKKYGIEVLEHTAINSTRTCNQCGTLNVVTDKLRFECVSCWCVLDQDENAAVNLSRLGNSVSTRKQTSSIGSNL